MYTYTLPDQCKTICCALLALMIAVITPVLLKAQWFNDGPLRNESRIPLTTLSTVPEYHTDMSLDCLIGYIAIDSLARSVDRQFVQDFVRKTSMDTLRLLARFMYGIMDYNPVLFERYAKTTSDILDSGSTAYRTYPMNVYQGVWDEILLRRLGSFGLEYAMLLASDYVLHVRIADKRAVMDSSGRQPKMYIEAACEVLEIFKGQYLPGHCLFSASIEKPKTETVLSSSNCIKFGYPKDWPTRTGFFLQNMPDTVTGCNTIREVQIGEEYVLFLVQGSLDRSTNFLLPENAFERTGGLFRITNGKVEDSSNFWGLGTQPTFTTFRTRLQQKITDIKTWWVH